MLDRDLLVFDGDDGGEVVDRERQKRAFPDPLAEPGYHVAAQTAFRTGRSARGPPS